MVKSPYLHEERAIQAWRGVSRHPRIESATRTPPKRQIAPNSRSSSFPGRAELGKALFGQTFLKTTQRLGSRHVSSPAPCATRGAHADVDSKQRQL
ncbi:hypothetical protein Taro_041279 [Colocasia esculenta]|uniref:Uncharacterized protein n=1 Tax=Colocasia esculenta TaxID=4460 RepID=A0A843WL69_COLES|nr:hypothetical protein [Colocasia esculenta]